jgi:hypothetical protein
MVLGERESKVQSGFLKRGQREPGLNCALWLCFLQERKRRREALFFSLRDVDF